ncbi:MAG: NAD(+)/NADH kinase [Coriobacteriia bacterium]
MRVLLVPNLSNPAAVAASVEVAAWLADQGVEPVFARADAERAGLPRFGVPPSELGEITLAVSLGGDGTILKAVHLLGDAEVPLLGLNFGKLGFLTGAAPEAIVESVSEALAGEGHIERRATLCAQVVMEGRAVGTYRALNEVAVEKGASSRVITLDVEIEGRRIMRTRADGLIVATATGSTAYALSAGGPIVSPECRGMVVVPVAGHTLQNRAILTSPSETVEISFPDPLRSDAQLIVDGEIAPNRRSFDRITVASGEHDVLLVKLDGRNFYDTVSAEFFGG